MCVARMASKRCAAGSIQQFFIQFGSQFCGKFAAQLLVNRLTGGAKIIAVFLPRHIYLLANPDEECKYPTCDAYKRSN